MRVVKMTHISEHFPSSLSQRHKTFRKVVLLLSTSEAVQFNQLRPMGKANLHMKTEIKFSKSTQEIKL
jgi:hypothetical protein